MRNLPLAMLLLGGCASSDRPAPNLYLRTEHENDKRPIYFETQKLYPRSKSVVMKTEGTPGKMRPPTIEAGEATLAYLHHWHPATNSLADDSHGTTFLFIFDHIPATPWKVELPAKGVDLLYFDELPDGKAITGEATGGWIEVREAGERRLTADLDLAITTHPPGAAKPVTLYLMGRFSVER